MSKKILVRHNTRKIFSIIFAIFLWFYVITEQNPVVPRDLIIPVRIANAAALSGKSLIMLNDPKSFSINLKIKGKKEILDIINVSNIDASADISSYNAAGDYDVPVEVRGLPEGVSVTSRSSQTIRVTLDRETRVQRPVTYAITGNPIAGLAYLKPSLSPSEIILTGAESLINKVKEVRVNIDIAGAGYNVEKTLPVILLDGKDQPVSGIQTNIPLINVTVPIANTKRVPIRLVTEGSTADGYIAANASVQPSEILITGDQQAMDSLTVINTGIVNISNLSSDAELPAILDLPEGIQLVDTNEEIKAVLDIQKVVSKTVEVSSRNIEPRNLSLRYRAEGILAKNINVAVRGPEDLLDKEAQNIVFYVDLRNAREGVSSYEILWDKTSRLEILEVSPQQISVDIRKNE